MRRVYGEGVPHHGGLRALCESLDDGQDAAREPRAAVPVRHLLRVVWLVDEAVYVLACTPPQRFPLISVLRVDPDGHGRPQVQVQLVRARAHVPVLQDLGAFWCEEGRRDLQRRVEARSRCQFDEAWFRRGRNDAVEPGRVVRDEARHHLLLEVAPDEVGEQHGQEVGELPAYDLRYVRRDLYAVSAGSLFIALHLSAIGRHGISEHGVAALVHT